MDHTGASQSLTARRQAASHLPTHFELPPPPMPMAQKYLPQTTLNISQSIPSSVSFGNLLTPPSNIPGDTLSPPISSGISSASASGQAAQPYTPTGFWQSPTGGSNPFSGGTGTTPQPWNQGSMTSLFPPRGMFSPSASSLVRNSSNSPGSSDSLPPPPPFDMTQLPPFPSAISLPPNLSANTAQQQQQAMTQAFMTSQTPVSAATSQASPVNASDSYGQRPPPTPTYLSGSQSSSTPQSSHFPAFQHPSPVQQSPLSASTSQGSRISPINPHPPSLQHAGSQQGTNFVRPYSFNLPGPIMSNIPSPNGQMAILGMPPNFNSGTHAHLQTMYSQHQQAPHNERPFKCDQCPQSFNRNHDLKRHKRIHLAVKPFPCGHCEKSFSRKDALKVRYPCF